MKEMEIRERIEAQKLREVKLKEESVIVEKDLQQAEKQGMYTKGSSPWGSWAFLTKPAPPRKPPWKPA